MNCAQCKAVPPRKTTPCCNGILREPTTTLATSVLKPYDERSGKGRASYVPQELYYWNWGAAGLTWIWGASNRVWFSFLALIPGISILIMIMLGLRGNAYAWRARTWPSVEAYLAQEKQWRIWGKIFFILHVIGILGTRYILNHAFRYTLTP